MKKYRLKKEAIPFFNEKYATSISCLDKWKQLHVDINALEEVKAPYISYGHRLTNISESTSGWERGKGAYFEFTIHFPSMQLYEHDIIGDNKVIRELMNKFQSHIDQFYYQFDFTKIQEEQ